MEGRGCPDLAGLVRVHLVVCELFVAIEDALNATHALEGGFGGLVGFGTGLLGAA